MGEIHQLETLFKQYQPGLFHFCMQYVQSREDALEIVNDTFMAVWDRRTELALDESLRSYLYTTVRNKALNFLKTKKIAYYELDEEFPVSSSHSDADELIHARETETFIFALIDRLPPKCRQIFLMSRREEMSYREIAGILEISEKTVENQISMALKFIRSGLEKKQNGNDGFRVVLWPWLAGWISLLPMEKLGELS